MTHSRSRLVELLDEHEIRLSRALGQNFVGDANTVRRIARMAAVGPGDAVIDVGAGFGSLTLALAETGASVTAVELDKRVATVLRREVEPLGVKVIEGDALSLDWNDVVVPGKTATLVANLPYNVGTHIVTRVLDRVPAVTRLVVMLQKEVAQRLVARVGDHAYGSLSVKIRYHADAKMLGNVPPTVFVPKPDVESSIVEIQRLDKPRVDVDHAALFALVERGFAQRRKMLRGVLGKAVAPEAFACAGIEPTARAEELDVVDWGRLVECASG